MTRRSKRKSVSKAAKKSSEEAAAEENIQAEEGDSLKTETELSKPVEDLDASLEEPEAGDKEKGFVDDKVKSAENNEASVEVDTEKLEENENAFNKSSKDLDNEQNASDSETAMSITVGDSVNENLETINKPTNKITEQKNVEVLNSKAANDADVVILGEEQKNINQKIANVDDVKEIDLTLEDDSTSNITSSVGETQKEENEASKTASACDAMDLGTDDVESVDEKENEDSNSSSVIEIAPPTAPGQEVDMKSDKEAVVIELGTNNDLNEADSMKMSSDDKSADYQVVDEIDLTKSDDEKMDIGGENEQPNEFEKSYVVPDYDDSSLTELEIDPEQDDHEQAKETKDFSRYWQPIRENPQEFTSWTYLLQFVEQDMNLPLARRAFNSFFSRYPLCYGYWKKFSELERRNGNFLRAQKILERGVRAIPLSVDLWIHVLDFYINQYNRPDAGADKVRVIFERAISAAGQEFRSEKLWNKYVKWEIENKNWLNVMAVYDKAMRSLTQHYSILFSDFKSFVSKHTPQELLSESEFKQFLSEVRKNASKSKKEGEKEDVDETENKEKGAENTEKEAENTEKEAENEEKEVEDTTSAPPDDDSPPTEDELKAVRTRIIEEKKKVYEETEKLVTKIWAFEEGIKRPYFHVKQLERAQLKNWREYLDFEIGRDDKSRVILLFERCLIACALYEDFWLKYTKYMARHDVATTSKIYERACVIHLPKKPNIHIQWAAHEEVLGNLTKATEIIDSLDKILPGMAMIRMRRVALQRRAGNNEAAEELLKSFIVSAAKDKEEIFYTRKLAWFLVKISNKKEEGKKLIKDLLPKYKSEVKLYNDLIEMEFQCAGNDYPVDEDEEASAMEAFNLALTSDKLTDDQKFVYSQRKLEFLEDFGRDVKHLQKVYDDHQKLLRSHKKRSQIDLTADETPSKKAKIDNASISVVGTSQLSNGASVASTTTAYATQQAGYATTDPSVYYQQQQGYWNYAKPGEAQAQQQQYNYSQQWNQYYGTQR